MFHTAYPSRHPLGKGISRMFHETGEMQTVFPSESLDLYPAFHTYGTSHSYVLAIISVWEHGTFNEIPQVPFHQAVGIAISPV